MAGCLRRALSIAVCIVLLMQCLFVYPETAHTAGASTVEVPKNLTVKRASSTSLVLEWNKVKGASGYIVYKKQPGKSKVYNKAKTLKRTKWTDKKVGLKKTGTYKVRAYKNVSGQRVYSEYTYVVSARAYTRDDKKANARKVEIYPTDGQTELGIGLVDSDDNVMYSAVTANKKGLPKRKVISKRVRWYSSNPSIAKVDVWTGKITAKYKPGKCYVYAIAHSGLKSNKYKVTVKDYAYEKVDIKYAPGQIQVLFNDYEKEIRDICSYYNKHKQSKLWRICYRNERFQQGGPVPTDGMIETVKRVSKDSPYVTEIEVDEHAVEFHIEDGPSMYSFKYSFDYRGEKTLYTELSPGWSYRSQIGYKI